MQIATFNCNSVRKRLDAILAWLDGHRPDVLALQETKVVDDDFPVDAFTEAGLHVVFRGQKSYNGVAMVTAQPAESASFGLGDDDGESGPRLAHIRYAGVEIVNTYVPQGSEIGTEKFEFKLAWFARLKRYLSARFDPAVDRVLWIGDLNVAPSAADVYDPQSLSPHVCYCDDVIAAWQSVVDWGFTDIFRKHLPEPKTYTFWDYRMRGGVKRGLGWRIDHILATPPLATTSTACVVDIEPRLAPSPSDHTFVTATFQ